MLLLLVYKAEVARRVYVGSTMMTLDGKYEKLTGEKPPYWLRDEADLCEVCLVPLIQRRVSEKMALCLEAVFTAKFFAADPERVRGGPWSVKRLTPDMKREINQVLAAVEGATSMKDEAEAVFKLAKRLARDSGLVLHLQGSCFKCKGPFRNCKCRSVMKEDHVHEDVTVVRAQRARRHTKQKSGCEKRKHLIRNGKMLNSEEFKRHQWGVDHTVVRRDENVRNHADRGSGRQRG